MKINKNKVLEKMKEKNITSQKDLAELLGISKSQLSNMLSEKYHPVKTNVEKLANLLDVKIIEILYDQLDLFKENENEIDRFSYKLDEYVDVKNVIPYKKYKVLETFAGAGGLALGLEKSGMETVGAIELDKHAAKTLKLNRPKWNVIQEDIGLVAENIYKYIDASSIDVLSGGYPCQSFSYAGQREGLADIRGTLFYPYSFILKELKPKVFIAENVKGLVNHDNGKTLNTMLKVFEAEDYTIYWNILNAWDYNVAQKRERIVIVGIRNDLVKKQKEPFRFPEKQSFKPNLRNILKGVPDSVGVEYTESKKKLMEKVPPGGCWIDLPEEVAKDYMGASWFSGGGKRGMARRLSWDEPSLTLTTSPNQKQTERCHPEETRPFTTREYARIQSFPDDWEFEGGASAVYRQIGNAVPVNMAEFIGKAVIKYLNQFE